jgi:diguanylate cyclase (GGDEF)-like protein
MFVLQHRAGVYRADDIDVGLGMILVPRAWLMSTPSNHSSHELAVLAGSLALVLVIALADHTLWKREMSSSVFYLLPIAGAAWRSHKRWTAFAIVVLAAAAWHVVDILRQTYSHPAAAYWNTGVRLVFFTITALFVSNVRRSLTREERAADTDALTGLANSRRFSEELEKELARIDRSGRPLTVAVLDLDNFKLINDRFGHPSGDQVLQEIATALRAVARATDLVARLGGDEFALLLPETDQPGATSFLERLQTVASGLIDRRQWPISLSIGAATIDSCATSASEILRFADALMYRVKNHGKNGIVVQPWQPPAAD